MSNGFGTSSSQVEQAYCLSDGTWRLPEQSGLFPPQGALHHAACSGPRLVLAGGVDEAGLQRRGLGRPTEVHLLDLTTWVWQRLTRQAFMPPLHSRAASVVLCGRLFIVGGHAGGIENQTDYVAVLDLRTLRWSRGAATGRRFAASGHSIVGGVLLGGLGRRDEQAPVAPLLPGGAAEARPGGAASSGDGQAGSPKGRSQAKKVPKWFQKAMAPAAR
mmetsp:Transcript_172334/g.547195  ORF Transcript_172334/g.547195 Transcript_172334/m.547195 type:complete len:217 (-) Transcript_172334:207-857(-)